MENLDSEFLSEKLLEAESDTIRSLCAYEKLTSKYDESNEQATGESKIRKTSRRKI